MTKKQMVEAIQVAEANRTVEDFYNEEFKSE